MTDEPAGQLPRAPETLGTGADESRVVALAMAACLGTFVGPRLPAGPSELAPLAAMVATAAGIWAWSGQAATRRVIAGVLLVAGVACVRSGQAARSYQPLEVQTLRAAAVVRSDPEPIGAGWRAELQLDTGERLEATAFGAPAFELQRLAVGDRILAGGRVRPIGDRPWLRARHIVGRLSLDDVQLVAPAAGFNRLVNELRSVIVDGASSFDDRARPLYTGLVIGDDRFQSLAQQAQFRASGLTHLLAVSGQNVAFVLLVVRPILMVLSRRIRLAAIVMVLVLFAAMTRAEPSVLRAATAAGVATWSLLTGRMGSGLRSLSVGVTGLILIDPFLLEVVGFQLSVAASAGIILVSPLVLARLPGLTGRGRVLSALTQALAVTVGAQLAVAPLLIHHFGPLPLASIPANLAAGWAAGLVMTLGLTVGPISGLLHRARLPAAATILQLPSRLLVDWVDAVAGWSADLDLPRLGLRSLASLAILGLVIAIQPRRPLPGAVVASLATMTAAVVLAGAVNPAPDRPAVIAEGVLHIPRRPAAGENLAILVVGDAPPSVIDAVLATGVDQVDVVVAERGDVATARIVAALTEVVDSQVLLAPPHHRIRGARRVAVTTTVRTAWGVIVIRPGPTGGGLLVELPPAATPAGWAARTAEP